MPKIVASYPPFALPLPGVTDVKAKATVMAGMLWSIDAYPKGSIFMTG